MARPRKEITPEEIVAWAWWSIGTPISKIAEQLDCSPGTISKWAKKINNAISKFADIEQFKKSALALFPLALDSLKYNLEQHDPHLTAFFFKNILGFADKKETLSEDKEGSTAKTYIGNLTVQFIHDYARSSDKELAERADRISERLAKVRSRFSQN